MNNFKTYLTRMLVITSLMLPWATTEALDTFKQAGAITDYSHDRFTLNGQYEYRVSPDAVFPSGSRPSYKHFKAGDQVSIEGKILNGRRYVDKMRFQPATDS